MKKVIIGMTLILASIGLLYGAIHLFGWYIFNTQSCLRFNIDNIELRTGVNIPAVITTECKCQNNTKVSKFIIDSSQTDIESYALKNNFTLIDQLYVKENDTNHTTFKVVLDKDTAALVVDITYK